MLVLFSEGKMTRTPFGSRVRMYLAIRLTKVGTQNEHEGGISRLEFLQLALYLQPE